MRRMRTLTLVVLVSVWTSVGLLPPLAWSAEQPLVEPVVATVRVAPGEFARLGLKSARPGVVITSATVRPRAAQQFVVPLNDAGLQGDTAGDGIWTVAFPVPDSVSPGLYDLDFEAQVTVDGQPRSATAVIQVEVVEGESRSVQIVTPQQGAVLSGAVEVKARLAPMFAPDRALVYLGAAAAEMERDGDLWKATLDTTRAQNGRQQLIVTTAAAGTSADPQRQRAGAIAAVSVLNLHKAIPVTVGNPYNHYWGNLHAHTLYSDGMDTPAVAYRHARDAAGIDFLAVTDHDDALTFDEYDDVRRQADAFDEPGKFAALWGVEWTQGIGHMNFYMADRFRLSPDLGAAYREFDQLGVLAHFNHPGVEDFDRARHFPEGAASMCAAEVRDAEEEQSYVALLDAGWRVGADGSQDNHRADWGDGPTWTVALARRLDRDAVLDAMRARRTYSTADRNMRLEFALDGEDMGAVISRPAGELPCAVSAPDPDPGDTVARIDAIVDGQVAASVEPKVGSYEWLTNLAFAPGRHYVYVRVTQADGNLAYSSPIWVQAWERPATSDAK